GATPSPALVKAALINSATDMDDASGTGPIPNNDEGWGRIDLPTLIGGERNFDFTDQTDLLIQDQISEKHFFVADDSMPLRFTMVYTDVPGTPAVIPALVNDLDLEVTAPDGTIYAGNQMLNGESVPGPAARDSLNNVECVYLNNPLTGEYVVWVRGKHINQDARRDTQATDQDFALVVSGGLPTAGHAVLAFDRRAYTAPATVGVQLIDFDLAGQADAFVTLKSTTETTPLSLHLLASGNIGVFTGAVATATGPVANDNKLQVANGDTITAAYQDTSPNELVEATRLVDLIPPIISSVGATNRFGNELVSWTTDEPASGIVRYGTAGALNQSITNLAFIGGQSITLTNMTAGLTYKYIVIAVDEAGNRSTNDNNGQQFSFVATPVSTVLLVDAYVHQTDLDDTPPIPVTSYTDALDGTGVSYDVWTIATDGEPTVQDLDRYRVVIWRIDDSFWSADNSISASEQTTIQTYLKHDGAFMMSSAEILSRVGDVPFRTNVFGLGEFKTHDPFDTSCTDCDEDHGVPSLEGLTTDSIGAGVSVTLDYSAYPSLEEAGLLQDESDTFVASTNAIPVFVDQDSGLTTGVRLPRSSKTPGRVVFMSFPFDTIPMDGASPNNRVSIMRNILAYLAPGVNGLGTLSLDRSAYTIPDRVVIEVADSDFAGKGVATTKIKSTTDTTGVTITLFETPRKGVFSGSINLIDASATPIAGQLRVTDGDTLTADYFDASANSVVEVSADVDAGVPVITGVTADVDYQDAIIGWSTDEPTDSLVQYGESAFLGKTVYRSAETFDHSLTISALQPDHTYYYQIVSRDSAGNTAVDDNAGKLYTFHTLQPKSVPWSDNMDSAATDWTVENTDDSEFGWERGAPNNGVAPSAHSGTNVWGSNLNASGGTYSETALISPAFLLTGGNRATLTFWHAYDFSVDATFQTATLQIITNTQANPVTVATYDGVSDWTQEQVDLSAYIGKVVQIVFFYQVLQVEEPAAPYAGWLVDDVSVDVTTENRGSLVVQANLSQANYTIEGPSPATGQGFGYTNTAALSGSYTITFTPVTNYNTPPPQTATLNPAGSLVVTGKYLFVDVNNNGISDEWETQYFGSASAAHAGNIDTDGDGASDFAEFMAGTSPTNPNDVLQFAAPAVLSDGRVQLDWPSVSGRSYRILGSTDAHTWTPYTDWIRSSSSQMVQTLPALPAGNAHFFQIQVMP
ncbi:MAG: choice-of-anchor J domain-containing protein, partial [Limisphaerales bacterium]